MFNDTFIYDTKIHLHTELRRFARASLNTILKYIQLVNLPQEENFICKVAKKSDAAADLIKAGYEYVAGEYDDGGMLFRKRKPTYLGSVSAQEGSWSSLDLKPNGDIPRKPPSFCARAWRYGVLSKERDSSSGMGTQE